MENIELLIKSLLDKNSGDDYIKFNDFISYLINNHMGDMTINNEDLLINNGFELISDSSLDISIYVQKSKSYTELIVNNSGIRFLNKIKSCMIFNSENVNSITNFINYIKLNINSIRNLFNKSILELLRIQVSELININVENINIINNDIISIKTDKSLSYSDLGLLCEPIHYRLAKIKEIKLNILPDKEKGSYLINLKFFIN